MEYTIMKSSELEECARIAAEAFYDYDLFTVYFPDEKRRRIYVNGVLKSDLTVNFKRPGSIYYVAREKGRIVALAQLCKPGFKRSPALDYIINGWLSAAVKAGLRNALSWLDMDDKSIIPCRTYPGKSWYLGCYAVAKAYQGQGIGSSFMQEFLIPYVRDAGADSFKLYTNSEINCRFYEKNGFTRFDERKFEYKGRVLGNWSYVMRLDG